MTFADEYQVQMFSGPFLEGSSDVEQCCDRNDIVCISYPGDFYEHQIPKRSLTAKKVVLNHFGLKSKCTSVRKLVPVVKSYVINITKHMMKVYN